MKIKGVDYNFGRVVYLTIGRIVGDPYKYTGLPSETMTDVVTIAFDPRKNPQLNTRIDFLIRHQFGAVSSITGSPCSLAAIDLYNIGPALQQFMDAYNKAKDNGYWKSVQISQYVCALQVGYQGSRKTTIFAGVINSYNVERHQTDSTVDTVWHLFCAGTGGYSTTPMSQSEIAESGQDYSAELQEQNQTMQSYISGEAYIKSIVMSHPRQVYTLTDMGIAFDGDSFQVQTDLDNMGLVALPKTINVTNKNFNQYFEIKYMAFNSGVEEEWTKEIWQNQPIKGIVNLDTSDLGATLVDVAALRNCYADIRLDENTGKQIIHIYSVGARKTALQKKTDYVIKDFQNLRKPPLVSGTNIRFDLMMEPGVRPYDTFELRVTDDFMSKYQKSPSFGVNFSGDYGNWATIFAGTNFEGLSNTITSKSTKKKTEQTGNVFNKKYVAINIIHQGSTHTPEWSTQVDCANVEE